jgi:putative transposase
MPRRARLCPPATSQHVIQRGNNRQICFCSDEDCAAYAHWLREAAHKYQVNIHAWVFMTNHVHLLVTPADEDGISLMMQSLGRQYVRYFNKAYRRTGTLCEGRFKSCLVQTSEYLLYCYRYIELNPVRANMVTDPADYVWSSHRSNACGLESSLRTPHEEYLRLGQTEKQRTQNYRSLFAAHLEPALQKEIRESLNTGLALGSERFKDELAINLAKKVRLERTGRKSSKQGEMLL